MHAPRMRRSLLMLALSALLLGALGAAGRFAPQLTPNKTAAPIMGAAVVVTLA